MDEEKKSVLDVPATASGVALATRANLTKASSSVRTTKQTAGFVPQGEYGNDFHTIRRSGGTVVKTNRALERAKLIQSNLPLPAQSTQTIEAKRFQAGALGFEVNNLADPCATNIAPSLLPHIMRAREQLPSCFASNRGFRNPCGHQGG
jgi:hypothetical protein